MLQAIREQPELGQPTYEGSTEAFFDRVEIDECLNGYARVAAFINDPTPTPDTQLEPSEQVFLVDEGGTWAVLTWGSGIDCSPPFRPPELEQACAVLGLTRGE